MKNGIFWDVVPCVTLVRTDVSRSVRRLVVTANVDPSSAILVTLMMEALSSSETSVLTRSTQHNIPESVILMIKVHLSIVLKY
jgi:hypothetical protein